MGLKTTVLRLFVSVVLLMTLIYTSSAQLSGNINVGTGQTYTTLTGAGGFFNAVNTLGLSGNVTALITSDIVEPGTISLNQWGGTNRITISPSAGTLRTLLSNDTVSAFTFDGADRVTVDGRFSGAGRFLRFQNSSTIGSTFRFTNDATLDTIRHCIIEGTNASTTEGVIEFTTTSGSTGNDNNVISDNLIRDYGGTTPQILIYSNGTTSSTARNNSDNIISNNELSNFYVSGQVCSGITLAGGTRDWTISGNSFYQTATRTTGAATVFIVINVNTSSANNITVSGNFIGGSSANCGGSAWTMNGGFSNTFYCIRFASAGTTTASNVNGNFIQNISLTSTPSSNGVIYFGGIMVESGTVNIGNTSGNTVGNSTGTGNINLSFAGSRTNLIGRGIYTTRGGTISNNTVGSVTLGGSNNNLKRFEAIVYSSSLNITTTISNNTIGSSSAANSIHAPTAANDIELAGIYSNSTSGTLNVTGNTIGNITSASTSNDAYVRGIFQNGGALTFNATSNTIFELLGAGTSTSRAPQQCPTIAIVTGSSNGSQIVSQNTIRGIRGNGNAANYIMAFGHYNPNGNGTFSRNRIYDITNSSTSGPCKIWVINAYWGGWDYTNNQITVTNGEASDYIQHNPPVKNLNTNRRAVDSNVPDYLAKDEAIETDNPVPVKPELELDAFTNGIEIKGIHDEAEFTSTYYYNTVYVGGSQSSDTSRSWCYDRPLLTWATPVTMRNNLFYNGRTGTGKHFAFGNEVGFTNWTSASSNYNVFIVPNISLVATWESFEETMPQWRLNSGGDAMTWCTTTSNIAAANLFTNISTGDLSITSGNAAAWVVSGKGIAVAGQNIDFGGTARVTAISGGTTDIGSDEFASTPPGNPTATVDNAPGSGVTSTYTLWSRTIIMIEWGTGGSSYPSALNVRYYSGVSPGGVLGGGYSNSYWEIIAVGNLTAASYDITQYFGDNETFSISTPSSNTRLAKYITSWEVFPSGTGPWQSELTWAAFNVKTRGLYDFLNYFSLTDGSNPLPVEMCSFNASVTKRDVQLNWTTCTETNNRGFDIERRVYNSAGGDYYPWITTGFVEGSGTTNEQHSYSYLDSRLNTGKYQYRLKQIDYNGNFEYYDLTSPSEVMVGTPVNADLSQNYPNPSNPTSKVDYQIPFDGTVSLKVYDITGRVVATLFEGQRVSGYYTSVFNGSGLASGVYFYRLDAKSNTGENFSKTMKLILIK